jgi:triacylglycerol lipase
MIDGDFILDSGTTLLLNGQFAKVPLLIGTNTDEGTSFAPTGINTDAEFTSYITARSTDTSTLSTLAALYSDIPEIGIPATLQGRPGPALGLQYKRVSAIIGDDLMHAPRRFMNQIWARNNLPSYSYRFNVIPNGVSAASGSNHFKEVAFVMDNVQGVGYAELGGVNPFAGKPESYKELAGRIAGMWASFVDTLDPNVAGGECCQVNPRSLD